MGVPAGGTAPTRLSTGRYMTSAPAMIVRCSKSCTTRSRSAGSYSGGMCQSQNAAVPMASATGRRVSRSAAARTIRGLNTGASSQLGIPMSSSGAAPNETRMCCSRAHSPQVLPDRPRVVDRHARERILDS